MTLAIALLLALGVAYGQAVGSSDLGAASEFGQALFYAVPGSSSETSFQAHAGSIGIIAPQSFALDRHGVLKGSLPGDLATTARDHSVEIMPLVINADFSKSGAAALLRSAGARDRAVGALVDTARDLDLAGWQIDFENLPSSQRVAFSRFVGEVARALHRHGKLLSVAVGARTSDDPTTYTYRTFAGVCDYSALGASADFLSVMAYPEGDNSHPGPLASSPWVERVIQHVLLQVPADKVSLGLPTYQTDWSERRVRVSVRAKIEGKIKHVFHFIYRLIHHNGAVSYPSDEPLQWDPVLESSYRVEGEGHHRHITWIEDERSFAAKLRLVAQYHLHGFSVWRIGLEDPHIWSILPDVSAAAADHR